MKGLGISVPPLHAGVRSDLETLLAAFKAKNTIRFEAFTDVFAALEMNLLFLGRQSPGELVEFEEHLLQLSAAYMMSVKSNEICGYPEKHPGGPVKENGTVEKELATFVERVFGVYCTYTYYYLQPEDYVAQIRISPAQLSDVIEFMEGRLRNDGHIDAMACLYKLLNDGAFRLTAFGHAYDPACHKRYEAEDEDESCLPPGADAPLERMKGLVENNNTLKQLDILHKNYEAAKKDAGFKGVTHGKIDVAESAKKLLEKAEIAIHMEAMGSVIEAGQGAGGAKAVGGGGSPSLRDIKQQAYASGVKPARHRRYAFAGGVDAGASSDEESDEDAPGPSTKKKGKNARKPQPLPTASTSKQEEKPKKERKKRVVVKKEPKSEPSVRVPWRKSKVEETADRAMVKCMKEMKEKKGKKEMKEKKGKKEMKEKKGKKEIKDKKIKKEIKDKKIKKEIKDKKIKKEIKDKKIKKEDQGGGKGKKIKKEKKQI